jgi:hypothetical protein
VEKFAQVRFRKNHPGLRVAWFRAAPFQTIAKPVGVVTLISQKILGGWKNLSELIFEKIVRAGGRKFA